MAYTWLDDNRMYQTNAISNLWKVGYSLKSSLEKNEQIRNKQIK